MLKLSLRNIFRHGVRTSLTLSAIAFSVVGLVISGGFVEDIFVQLREMTIHSQLGHVQIYRTGYSTEGRRKTYQFLITNDELTTHELKTIPHVEDVLRRLSFSGLANNGLADVPILAEGVEPDKESKLGTAIRLMAGRQLEDQDQYGIVVGQGVAAALNLQPGDYLTLLANTRDGALNSLDFSVTGVFQTFSKDYDNRAVRIPLSASQELLATTGYQSLVLSLDKTDSTDDVVEQLRTKLGPEFEIFPWYDLADFYNKTVELYRRQFGTLQFIILVMVVLSVTSSVNMTIFERIGEFGTLMALGERKKHVFRLILTENLLLGIFGAGCGILGGALLAYIISKIGIPMPPPPNSDVGYTATIRIASSTIGWAFTVGILATVLASLLPAQRATRTPIATALRQNI